MTITDTKVFCTSFVKYLCIILLSYLIVAPNATAEVTGNVSLTTDYVWRGVSQSLGYPAVQGGLDWEGENGLSAGVWASNVDFVPSGMPDDGADLEFDIYASYGFSINEDWNTSIGAIKYIYPGTAPGVEYDWAEVNFNIDYKELVSLSVNYSDDALASGEAGTYYQLSGGYSINDMLSVDLTAGYYDTSDLYTAGKADEENYSTLAISISSSWEQVDAAITFHTSDGKAPSLYEELWEDRIVFTVGSSF